MFSHRGITRIGFADCGPIEIGDLAKGKDYVMQVRARNKNGPGPYSAKSSTMTTGEVTQLMRGQNMSSIPGIGQATNIQGPTESHTASLDPATPPFARSDSYQTMESQRDQAEARAKDLAEQRSLAEQAMLRIDREREGLSEKLLEARKRRGGCEMMGGRRMRP